jgi:hypothetical protein
MSENTPDYNVIKNIPANEENSPDISDSSDEKESSEIKTAEEIDREHQKSIEIFEEHRNFFENYARGQVDVAPAPKGLNTFAFDLEKNTIYLNDMFYKNRGFSDERTVFAVCHEIEHFLEKKQILAEKGGLVKFEKYLARDKKSKAFSLTDNCVADIHVNRTVVSKTSNQMAELEQGIYKEVLFKKTDFTDAPKHIQFPQALLREARVPDEKCKVDPEVRKYLDKIQNMKGSSGRSFMEVLTNPETSMSDRLDLQDRFIMPIVEALKEKDIEEEKEKRRQKREQQKSQNQGDQQDQQNQQDQKDQNNQNKNEESSENGENPEQSEPGGENAEKQDGKPDSGNNNKSEKKSGDSNDSELDDFDQNFDPNEFWKEEYEKAEENVPNAVPIEKIEEILEKFKENHKDESQIEKERKEKADQDYAESIGVTKEELQLYKQTLNQIEKIVNPETGKSVIEEIRELISRIISKRKKQKLNPKYPTEEGEILVDPTTLITEIRAGNLNPKVWETTYLKEKPDDKFGEIEITLVADRSISMRGEKAREQLKSAVLMMEALKEFSDICKEEKRNLKNPLKVRSEIYSFQATSEDSVPIKEMSPDLSETERIKTAAKLSSANGSSTTDFVTLDAINDKIDQQTKDKINLGEVKKIIIVFTDGESDDPISVQNNLKKLRDTDVVVVGVGITASGKPALTTYAPEARLAEKADKLSVVLADVLKEHISKL